MTATQLASRPQQPHRRKEPWVIEVDASEIREISKAEAATGDSLVWKAAMWGSPRDGRLIRSMRGRYISLGKLAQDAGLIICEGPQLRSLEPHVAKRPPKTVVFRKELVGQSVLAMVALRRAGRIHHFPQDALKPIRRNDAFIRKRGGVEEPLRVCRPPHVIVQGSRGFAIYTDKFVAVPPRQIGIAGSRSKVGLLKAIALILNSNYSLYHDFMVSPEWGVHIGISTLSTLKAMPVPFEEMSAKDISRWAALYDKLAKADKAKREFEETPPLLRTKRGSARIVAELEVKLNDLVYEAFGLDEDERALVEDMVNVKMGMVESKWDETHVALAPVPMMEAYALTLKRTLDGFLDKGDGLRHEVSVLYGNDFAWITITLAKKRRTAAVKIEEALDKTADTLDEVRRQLRHDHGQWLYFNRTLRIFEGKTTHMTKPRYRLAWLKSQALADADDLIADILYGEGG